MFKMLVLDLDGTLLDSQKAVSAKNIQAIVRASRLGMHIVLATGRPPVGTMEARASLGSACSEFLIAYNGALIENMRTGMTVFEQTITVAGYLQVAQFAASSRLFCYAYSRQACLTPEPHAVTDWENQINGIDVQLTDFSRLDPAMPLIKAMVTGDPDLLDQCQENIPANLAGQFTILRSAPELLEFLSPQASKGRAVSYLAGILGIGRQEIICVGDSGNDKDMIQYAGLGVAMDNATAEIKAAADFVTRSNDNHGIAHLIDQIIG
ncbi:MAG TPA: Cof-type HAD-IIB family hydrolase [Clostridiales bacterium]|nr:Cof-type HAD-IIB family hydrolase [Clostridiales bacterium]